jgi:hypothetical protein
MKRATVIGLMGLTMIVLSARPALAQWDWFKWIQQLSGPGPFELNGVTVTFACRDNGDKPQYTRDTATLAQRALFCDRISRGWRDVDRFLGLTIANGDGENTLIYPVTIEPKERVSAWMVRFSATKRLHELADIGSGIGYLRFSAAEDQFVVKYFFDPFVSIRPLAFLVMGRDPQSTTTDYKVRSFFARSVDVTGGALIFPQGFRLSDFGAIGGADLTGDAEISWHWGLRFTVVF